MLTKDNLKETLADVVMDRPREFFVGGRRFCLWSPSLGVSLLSSHYMADLGIDEELMRVSPAAEALRLAEGQRAALCALISLHTFRSYRSLIDSRNLRERAHFFSENLSGDELAELFLLILAEPKIERLMELTGLDEERRRIAEISEVKKQNSSSLSFGGRTLFGSLIVPAVTTLGLTPDQVIWGISLLKLRMLLADSITTICLSEEEAKALGSRKREDTYGMTAADFDQLRREFQD